jgi:hypothetical protein
VSFIIDWIAERLRCAMESSSGSSMIIIYSWLACLFVCLLLIVYLDMFCVRGLGVGCFVQPINRAALFLLTERLHAELTKDYCQQFRGRHNGLMGGGYCEAMII